MLVVQCVETTYAQWQKTVDLGQFLVALDELLVDGQVRHLGALVAILVNQYSALAGSTEMQAAPALGEEEAEGASELLALIEDLNLTARTTNALVNNSIRTVHDLINLTEQDLRELKGFGSKALDEVKDKIAELNL